MCGRLFPEPLYSCRKRFRMNARLGAGFQLALAPHRLGSSSTSEPAHFSLTGPSPKAQTSVGFYLPDNVRVAECFCLKASGAPRLFTFENGGGAMHHLVDVVSTFVEPTITGKEASQLIMRWFHFLAGITWVGLLYFFNLINVPFMKTVDAPAKPKILEKMVLPALNWFRWSALLTVLIGLAYWGQYYIAVDAQREGRSAGGAFGLFFLLWIRTWLILYLVIKKWTPSGYILGVITTILVYIAGWFFVNRTPVGGEDIHVLAIGVGGGMGIVMLFNVWGVIWPNNKKIIGGAIAGT